MKKYHQQNPSEIHLSIVSHGQWSLVLQLLNDLAKLHDPQRLQLTLTFNIKESYDAVSLKRYPFAIKLIHNDQVKGFAHNHNQAFKSPPIQALRRYFVVLNPDIRIKNTRIKNSESLDVFSALIDVLEQDKTQTIAMTAPEIRNEQLLVENSARELPTPARILAKVLGQNKQWQYKEKCQYFPDWCAGMFMLFPIAQFEALNGFNESYFLYYEDVDLCSRLWLSGQSVCVDSRIYVIHNAQRSSHKKWNYLIWHVSSIMRFFTSSVYRRVKIFHLQRHKSHKSQEN